MNVHASLVKASDALLLLVDYQKSIFDLCVSRQRVLSNTRALIQLAGILGMPVFFTEHNPEKLGGFLPELTRMVVDPMVFSKIEFGCFGNQHFASAMEQTGKKTIILAGIETHVCIFQTGAQAVDKGFKVHLVGDAVSARSSENHQIGIGRLEKAGAILTSTEMVLFELLEKAGTTNFRKALPIIKTL